jgi:hypothetical protein
MSYSHRKIPTGDSYTITRRAIKHALSLWSLPRSELCVSLTRYIIPDCPI